MLFFIRVVQRPTLQAVLYIVYGVFLVTETGIVAFLFARFEPVQFLPVGLVTGPVYVKVLALKMM
jgi:hypothetical protein